MGFAGFVYRQALVHPQVPDGLELSGQTVLVTGSNVGIGFEACRQLIGFGVSRIIMAVRKTLNGERAKIELLKSGPSCDIEVWELDMDSYESIMAFGRRVQALDRLDIVMLNAGVKKPEYTQNTLTGHETTIQVNHLATSLLSLLLLPTLQASAARFGGPSRMTITSSEVHMWTSFKEQKAPNILENLDDPGTFTNPDRYNVSKLLNVLWARELAAQVSPRQVIINTVNPGLVKSSLHRENTSQLEKGFTAILGRTAEEGARALVDAASVKGVSSHGGYTSECKEVP